MSNYRLAMIIKNPSNEEEFLAVKQTRPPKFGVEEYDSYIDSDLWDFPSIQLEFLQEGESSSLSEIELEGADQLCSDRFDLRKFNLVLALTQVSDELGIGRLVEGHWGFWKYVEEPEFGPGPPIQTVFITGSYDALANGSKVACLWMSQSKCPKWLLEVKQDSDRLGPLLVSFLHDTGRPANRDFPQNSHYQEYPWGVMLVPMKSRTGKPFSTTSLVVFAPETVGNCQSDKGVVAHGDALIVDPGCSTQSHHELMDILAALPGKLIVFATHHHYDHVDGLSVVQKCKPDAVLLAHENTIGRINKDDWSLGSTSVKGGEIINVRGQQLQVIFAPGHTDGHMALLHMNTHGLIVGDHCVGQGSAILDIHSGGNMTDYFETTYKFLELSPHALIPMHGRVNLWPKHMLCGYLKNRRDRESSVLKAIEDGKSTLFDLVATIYKKVDRDLWIPASWNVRLHVEHLAQQNKLPQDFLPRFERSCGLNFGINWAWAYTKWWISSKIMKNWRSKIVIPAVLVVGAAVLYKSKNFTYL